MSGPNPKFGIRMHEEREMCILNEQKLLCSGTSEHLFICEGGGRNTTKKLE